MRVTNFCERGLWKDEGDGQPRMAGGSLQEGQLDVDRGEEGAPLALWFGWSNRVTTPQNTRKRLSAKLHRNAACTGQPPRT